jgi:hypothetical protein
MDRVCKNGVDVVWWITAHISWYGKNKVADRPLTLCSCFPPNWWATTNLDYVENLDEFLNETRTRPGDRYR